MGSACGRKNLKKFSDKKSNQIFYFAFCIFYLLSVLFCNCPPFSELQVIYFVLNQVFSYILADKLGLLSVKKKAASLSVIYDLE
jgi:hypothetical protein